MYNKNRVTVQKTFEAGQLQNQKTTERSTL